MYSIGSWIFTWAVRLTPALEVAHLSESQIGDSQDSRDWVAQGRRTASEELSVGSSEIIRDPGLPFSRLSVHVVVGLTRACKRLQCVRLQLAQTRHGMMRPIFCADED